MSYNDKIKTLLSMARDLIRYAQDEAGPSTSAYHMMDDALLLIDPVIEAHEPAPRVLVENEALKFELEERIRLKELDDQIIDQLSKAVEKAERQRNSYKINAAVFNKQRDDLMDVIHIAIAQAQSLHTAVTTNARGRDENREMRQALITGLVAALSNAQKQQQGAADA